MRNRGTVTTLIAIGAVALLGVTAPAQQTGTMSRRNENALNAMDKKFVMMAAQGGMAEVKEGQLAADKGANSAVKQFGERMVKDHGKANDELKQLATEKGLTLPEDIGAKNRAGYDKLASLSGAAFDRTYSRQEVKDHEQTIALFRQEVKRGHDPDLKRWAQQTLPTLEEHLRMAKALPDNRPHSYHRSYGSMPDSKSKW